MTDKEFWTLFRRALLLIIAAIERKYQLGKWNGVISEIKDDTVTHT